MDPYNGLKTICNELIIDRGMSFEAAVVSLEHERLSGDASGFRRSRRPIFGRTIYLLALQKPGSPNLFSICRPNTGEKSLKFEFSPSSAKASEQGDFVALGSGKLICLVL